MKKKIALIFTILVTLIFLSGFFWYYEARFMVGRADISRYTFSVQNSYVFATPLQAKANGKERIRVTVFILNNQGLGVLGKKVSIATDPNLTVESIQGLTDNLGKAIFDITSNTAGEYFLEVKVEDVPLNQKVKLVFN